MFALKAPQPPSSAALFFSGADSPAALNCAFLAQHSLIWSLPHRPLARPRAFQDAASQVHAHHAGQRPEAAGLARITTSRASRCTTGCTSAAATRAAARTGLAHFFEHMMFNGTVEASAAASSTGSWRPRVAATTPITSQDVTVYQDWFPSSALELVFELESDRIANLAFDPDVVENERKVVYSERRLRVDDSNAALLDEQVQATAFLAHPYGFRPSAGRRTSSPGRWMTCRTSIHSYYAPNNCTLVWSAMWSPRACSHWRSETSARFRARAAAAGAHVEEPEQLGERRHRPDAARAESAAAAGLSRDRAGDAREPALNVLQTILVGGDAAGCTARWSRSTSSRSRSAAAGRKASIRMCSCSMPRCPGRRHGRARGRARCGARARGRARA